MLGSFAGAGDRGRLRSVFQQAHDCVTTRLRLRDLRGSS